MADETDQLHRDVAFAKWSATIIAKLEHIEQEQDEHGKTLVDMRNKLDSVTTDLATKSVRMEKIEDLDTRLVALEKNFWKASGIIGFVAVIIPLAFELLKFALGK